MSRSENRTWDTAREIKPERADFWYKVYGAGREVSLIRSPGCARPRGGRRCVDAVGLRAAEVTVGSRWIGKQRELQCWSRIEERERVSAGHRRTPFGDAPTWIHVGDHLVSSALAHLDEGIGQALAAWRRRGEVARWRRGVVSALCVGLAPCLDAPLGAPHVRSELGVAEYAREETSTVMMSGQPFAPSQPGTMLDLSTVHPTAHA
eukprot:2375582-Rhodomonas_salina.3